MFNCFESIKDQYLATNCFEENHDLIVENSVTDSFWNIMGCVSDKSMKLYDENSPLKSTKLMNFYSNILTRSLNFHESRNLI